LAEQSLQTMKKEWGMRITRSHELLPLEIKYQLRQQYDPHDLFRSSFIERVFAISSRRSAFESL